MRFNDYKKLIVWQKSMDVVELVYTHTKKFPKEEIYGLVSQIRRSAVSIPSNIAEGSGRKTKKEFSHFLTIALGSTSELETQLRIAQRLDFISDKDFKYTNELLIEVIKMLHKLIESNY